MQQPRTSNPLSYLRYLTALSLVLVLMMTVAASGDSRRATLDAVAVTGFNRLFGLPIYQYPLAPPPLQTIGFEMVAEYNAVGDDSVPLSDFTPKDALLASHLDPTINILFPELDLAALAHLTNIPLQEIPTPYVLEDFSVRATLPPHLEAFPQDFSVAAPNEPITLEHWLSAEGQLTVIPSNDGTSTVKIRVENMVPNRLYSVWLVGVSETGEFLPLPLGGVPNLYVTDDKGKGKFKRKLNFNLLDPVPGIVFLAVLTHLRSDHMNYGAIPGPVFEYPPGSVIHTQLHWDLVGIRAW